MEMIALAWLLLTASSDVVAMGPEHGLEIVVHIFEMADGDGSGTLSPEEYSAAGLDGYGVPFEEADLDADGETTLDEYLDLYEQLHPVGGFEEA